MKSTEILYSLTDGSGESENPGEDITNGQRIEVGMIPRRTTLYGRRCRKRNQYFLSRREEADLEGDIRSQPHDNGKLQPSPGF